MERRESPQESLGLCHRLFRLIMNSLAFQSVKRIVLRHPGDQYVPISMVPQNEAHSVADGSFDTTRNLIEDEKDGKFSNENTTATAAKAANGHKAIVRKKGGGDDGERLNGKVNDMNIIPVQVPGIVDKVKTEDRPGATATTSIVSRGRDANKVMITNSDASKRDDQKNDTHLSIDEKAEQFIKKKREAHGVHIWTHSTDESRSGAPRKKKTHHP